MASAIRDYREADAPALRLVFIRAIEGLGPRHYSAEQVATWAAQMGDEASVRAYRGDGRRTWVAVDDQNQPVAYIDLEDDGHIDHLFCLPEAAGQGLASALYHTLETAAHAANLKRLYVEASESAKPVFARHGFSVTARQDFEIAGVAIHNYAMEKLL